MKKLKNISLILASFVLITGLIIKLITPVYAQVTGTFGVSGSSTATVGSDITVTVYVSNLQDISADGVNFYEAVLVYDNNYLKVSSVTTANPYVGYNDKGTYIKIAGQESADPPVYGLKGTGKNTVLTIVFTPLKTGTTTLTFDESKDIILCDSTNNCNDSNDDIAISPLNITINAATPSSPSPSTSTSPSPSTSPSAATKSSDATLKTLKASGYDLSPSFSSGTTSYTVTVPNSATKVTLDATANDSKAKVSGDGDVTLTGDSTTATVKVTAEDGTTKSYTVTIKKEAAPTPATNLDDDATLKELSVAGYTLSPTFNKKTTSYSIKVPNSVTSLNVSATPTSDKATRTISDTSSLKVGMNTVSVKVTAEDGSTNTYTINVERASASSTTTSPKTSSTTKSSSSPKTSSTTKKSSDNYLKSLTIESSHEISPKFNKDTSSYDVTVPYEVDKLELLYETSDSKATVKVTGNSDLKVGKNNVIEVTVTAEDGSKRVYTLNVTRNTEEAQTDLKELSVEEGELSPTFDPDDLEYFLQVKSNVDKLTITATPKNSNSKVKIIGNDNLKEGHNTVLVQVTDKNGYSKIYTLDVYKKPKGRIFGLTYLQFGIISLILLLLLLLLLYLLLHRKKEVVVEEHTEKLPVIEVKPEFNFNSKNTSDDDIVHGDFNQDSDVFDNKQSHKQLENVDEIGDSNDDQVFEEADYEEKDSYNPALDETVTKQELIDAIKEGARTKDSSKLELLLEQDALNQKKKAIRKKEQEKKEAKARKNNTDYYDEDYWK
jgi:hypothetical protein